MRASIKHRRRKFGFSSEGDRRDEEAKEAKDVKAKATAEVAELPQR
jgi:hypothetical protein